MTGSLTEPGVDAETRTSVVRPRGSGDPVEAPARVLGPSDPRRPSQSQTRWLAGIAVVAITAFGAFLRLHGLSDVGLWRDDAWVALSANVSLGSAWHMWDTAPGAFLIVRTALVLGSRTALSAQLPAFIAGVIAIPAVYLLMRWFRLRRVVALLAAIFICLSPECVLYSSRVKEYELDILLSCLVLALGEWARRSPGRRPLTVLAACSVLAFACSASVGAVVAGVWGALTLFAWRDHESMRRRHVAMTVTCTVIGCVVVGLIFYAHISPKDQVFWSPYFLSHGSLATFVSSLSSTTWHLFAAPFSLEPLTGVVRAFILTLWLATMAIGLRRNRAMAAPALALGVAYVLSVLRVAPLGAGRTDLYLYPVLGLLTGSGVSRLVSDLAPAIRSLSTFGMVTFRVVAAGAVVLLVGLSALWATTNRPVYPAVDVSLLAAQIKSQELPGDHIFVGELMRYPWALAEDPVPTVRLGPDWAAGFTVVSTDPMVFIAPSEYYEGDSHPKAWAADMTSARRIWYVWSPPLSFNPSYRALRDDGWRPERTLHVTGAVATLLERNTDGGSGKSTN